MTPSRRPALGVALLFFVNGAAIGSWLPRIPELRDRLVIDLRTVGLVLAMGAFGSLLGSSVSGVLIGRGGARKAGVVGALLLLAILPLVAVVPGVIALAAVLASMGFVDSLADVGMNAVGVRVEEGIGRSIMTRLHGVWSLGTLVGSGLSALAVLIGVGLGAQLLTVSVLGMGAVAVAARLIPAAPPRAREGGRAGKLVAGLMLAGGTAVFIEGVPFDWSAIFLLDETGASPAVAGAGVICFTAGMLIGRFAGDYLVDRFRPIPTLFAGIGISVAAMVGVVSIVATVPSLVGLWMWGLGISVALPVLYKLAGSHRSFGEGSGLAALTVGTRLGFMVSPAVVGAAATAWTLPTAILVVIILAALATLTAIRVTLTDASSIRDSLPGAGVS